jgi:hypothetical protein
VLVSALSSSFFLRFVASEPYRREYSKRTAATTTAVSPNRP